MTPPLNIRFPHPLTMHFGIGVGEVSLTKTRIRALQVLKPMPCLRHPDCKEQHQTLVEIRLNDPQILRYVPHLFGGIKNERLSPTERICTILVNGTLPDGMEVTTDLRQSIHTTENWQAAAKAMQAYCRTWKIAYLVRMAIEYLRTQVRARRSARTRSSTTTITAP